MADISQITLPNGVTYDIKDTVARNMISGGVSFIIAWDGNSTPVPANIPAGVTVTYNGNTYTGTLSANSAESGAFYLVRSSTSVGTQDSYDEYVPVGTAGSKTWEKIGDTQVDLSDVVTDVTLNKGTTTVLGTGTTISMTQPTTTLSVDSSAGTGKVNISRITALSNVYLYGRASDGAVSASGDNVSVVTGYNAPPAVEVLKKKNSTTKYSTLATTTITGVSGSTSQNVVKSRTSQTTATGAGTASTTNTDWLKGVSVSGEVLIIGAATMNTQTTYSAGSPSSITLLTADSSATTVATGGFGTPNSSSGFFTTENVVDTPVIQGLGTPSTTQVLGSSTTFTVTNPTITLDHRSAPSTGSVQVIVGGTRTDEYLSATTSGASATITADSKTVLTDAGTTLTVTKG